MLAGRPTPAFRARWAALLAAGAGGLDALAFPQVGIWPFALVSVAGLSAAVDGRRSRTGAWLGFLYGLAFFVPLLHWTGVYVGAVPWLLLAATEAAFCAGLGAVLPLVQRLRVAPVWVACTWVLQEALRDRLPFGGFPWGRLAFSQADSPLRSFASLGGAPLVSFAVALVGAAVVPVLHAALKRNLGRALEWLIPLVLLGLSGQLLGLAISSADPRTGQIRVALIQGSVPARGLAFEDRAREVLDNHVAATMTLAARVKAGAVAKPDLVLWPENSSDVDPFQDKAAFDEIDAAVKAIDAPVLIGAILQGPGDKRRNAGILWSPVTGPGAQYVKRHPVPFGEYIPLRSLAERVSSAAKLVTQDMVGGHGNGLVRGGPVPLGDVICFEVAYDSLVQSSVRAGAQLLVVQTNNSTFGHTSETYQQLAMSRLRAIETDRTVLQVATTGTTAIIRPDGTVAQQSGALFTSAILSGQIEPRTGETLAVRLGPAPEYALAALGLLAMGWSLRRTRRLIDRAPHAGRHKAAEADDEMVTT